MNRGYKPKRRAFSCLLLSIALWQSSEVSRAATTLPFGPLPFSINAGYDLFFKEPQPPFNGPFPTNGIARSGSGYLSLSGQPTGLAVLDTSSTGGVNGQGGTAGSDANNDLMDFRISADLACSANNLFGGGFMLRLNNSEADGYLATVHAVSPSMVVFDVYAGASLDSPGFSIFSQGVPLSGVTLTGNTFYPFKVTMVGKAFDFDFANGAATATYTDVAETPAPGQVGIILDTANQFVATRLDNFQIRAILPGDANDNGVVDGGDYTTWADHYLEGAAGFSRGDFNGNGFIDGGDYTLWADNFAPASSLATSPVPEPTTAVLFALGSLVVSIGNFGYWRRAK